MFTLGLQCFSIMKPVSSRSLRPQKNCIRARYWFFKIQCIASSYCLFSLTAESSWTSTYVIPPPPSCTSTYVIPPPPLMRSPQSPLVNVPASWLAPGPVKLYFIRHEGTTASTTVQLVGFYGLLMPEWMKGTREYVMNALIQHKICSEFPIYKTNCFTKILLKNF